MKKLIALVAIIGLMAFVQTVQAQAIPQQDSTETVVTDSVSAIVSTVADSSAVTMDDVGMSEDLDADAGGSVHFRLKKFFIDGTPLFMSLVALALVLGLAFCIERITYLTLSEINAKKLMNKFHSQVILQVLMHHLEKQYHKSNHHILHLPSIQVAESLPFSGQ